MLSGWPAGQDIEIGNRLAPGHYLPLGFLDSCSVENLIYLFQVLPSLLPPQLYYGLKQLGLVAHLLNVP